MGFKKSRGEKLDKKKLSIDYKAEYKNITIKTLDGAIIQGKINLALNQRVSDIFTKSDAPFIVMIDAFSKETEGKILFVNKRHIIWAEPEEDSSK